MAVFTRASRDYDFVPGSGSHVEIAQYDHLGVLQPSTVLDVQQGFVRQILTNQDTTHSGSNGAVLRTRVSADWNFALVLSFPAKLKEGLSHSFVESLLGSSRSVAMAFFVGDPKFWTSQQLSVRSYRATKALLSTVETVLDSSGKAVVGLNIAGEGNSLLWTYEDDVPIHPGVWF